MEFLSNLINRFRQSPQQLTGQGIARQGAETIAARPYQLYTQEMQMMGQQPLPMEEWLKQYRQQPEEAMPVRMDQRY
jgi:hypothetical protein